MVNITRYHPTPHTHPFSTPLIHHHMHHAYYLLSNHVYANRIPSCDPDAFANIGSAVGKSVGKVGKSVGRVGKTVGKATSGLGDTVSSTVNKASSTVQDTVETAQDTVGKATGAGSEVARGATGMLRK